MNEKRALVTIPTGERHRNLLQQAAPGWEFRFRGTDTLVCAPQEALPGQPVTQEDVDWAQVILGNVPAAMLHGSPALEWLQTNSAGVEAYIQPGVLAGDTLLTNATGAYGLAIAEHMLGMLLELFKKLELYRDAQKSGAWQSQGAVKAVYGSTVLVLGMGDIGGEFAARCKALGAKVIGVRRSPRPCPEYADEVHLLEDLDSLLPQADVVAITLPGTDATRGLMSRERLAKMKEGAVLLNVGRGFIVDTEALCDALERGHLSGAGVDVTDPEPLPPTHRLWNIPTAVVTPHISGFYHLRETHERIVGIFLENLRHFQAGEPLRNLVDFATGYRKLS
ncbi:MAG TPA: D-2-hydroxyacid dehydrogenase [Candidatus Acutalibacter ornithocaccae]|uniref:D-2-hydroxyacid dehydrogenase n=1 Tax=Candidatus Acutalibacter ornithocaccae TaxID=2838416 RepID=A0A9D2LYQ6_9FIRM|nr:D-2-hydroxyacid dehydrogenase [Candidatus Acutalibacter ornithocaccae]